MIERKSLALNTYIFLYFETEWVLNANTEIILLIFSMLMILQLYTVKQPFFFLFSSLQPSWDSSLALFFVQINHLSPFILPYFFRFLQWCVGGPSLAVAGFQFVVSVSACSQVAARDLDETTKRVNLTETDWILTRLDLLDLDYVFLGLCWTEQFLLGKCNY